MRKLLLISTVMAGMLGASWVRVAGRADSPIPPEKIVMKSDSHGVFIRTTIEGFNEVDTSVDNKSFKRIAIPEEQVDWDTTRIGKPQIPYITLLIAVPDSATFDITVHPCDPVVFHDYPLYPMPHVVFEDSATWMTSEEVFTNDTAFYEKDTTYPDKFYDISRDGHWRDQRILELYLYPVQCNPERKLMYYYHGIDVRIAYVGTIIENTNGLGPFEDIGRETLLNYPGVQRQPPPHEPPTVHYYTDLLDTNNVADYLIVAHEDFITDTQMAYWIQAFAQWRVTHNKLDIGIVRMQDIYAQFPGASPDSAEQLRDFLIHAYRHWKAPSIPDNHFAYCLFIGDWDYVPTKYRGYDEEYLIADEGYFRDLDSLPRRFDDIMLGRWSVTEHESQDFVTIAQKTINYEKFPSLGDWRRRGLLIGGYPGGSWDYLVSQSTRYFTDIGYDTFTVRGIKVDTSLFVDSVNWYLNLGEIIVTFFDHGGPLGWNYNYSTSEAEDLTNDDKLPVILSDACLTASFHYDRPLYYSYPTPQPPDSDRLCFGEAMLFNPNGGAVAFYGATARVPVGHTRTIMERTLNKQQWILGQAVVNAYGGDYFCVLGDPALDFGDYTAYPDVPDLVIRPRGIDISLSSPYPYPTSGASIPIHAVIYNIGGAPAHNVAVEFRITPPQAQPIVLEDILIPDIAPRESVAVTNYWNTSETHPGFYGEIGNCEFTVIADPDSDIAESWEKNNASAITKKVVLYPNEPNWPKKVTGFSQPAIANLDGIGSAEIVYCSLDSIFVYDDNGAVLSGWPQYFSNVRNCALGDINGDDTVDIVVCSQEYVSVYDYHGATLSGWPQHMPYVEKKYNGYPSLGTITSGGNRQIILFAQTRRSDTLLQPKILIYNYDGTVAYSFNTSQQTYYSLSCGPSVSDINGGGDDEIIVSYTYGEYDQGQEGLPFATDMYNRFGFCDSVSYGSSGTIAALADVDGDRCAEVILGDDEGKMRTYKATTDTVLWTTKTGGIITSSPAVGDINMYPGFDGNEIAFGNNAKEIWAIERIFGNPWTPWPDTAGGTINTSPALAYIDTTDGLDIMLGSNDHYMHAWKFDDIAIPPFPLPLFSWHSSPLISDIDGDGKSETVLASYDGYLHVWENKQSQIPAHTLEWPQFHHDYQRTGLYGWVSGISDGRVYPGELRPPQPTAIISLYVEEESLYTQVNVYDSEGKQVRTIANQTLTQGPQSLLWDGKDDRYVLLPNGLYFIEVKVRDETSIMPIRVNF